MTQLTHGDLQSLTNCIREIYANLKIESFPTHIISAISKVIPSCVTSYAKITQKEQKINYSGIASCRKWDKLEAFGRYMHEHPLTNFLHSELLQQHRFKEDIEKAVHKRYPYLKRSPHNTAARISDVLTDRQFQSLAVYNEFFRPNGVEYQLVMSLLPRPDGYCTISFNRDKIDFSEEERLILNLLAPHIIQAYRNAEAVSAMQRNVQASAQVEAKAIDSLTLREAEALHWVAQGKDNATIAAIMHVKECTVKKHMENIFAKLGVENRTAAAMMAMGRQRDTSALLNANRRA